LLECRPLGPPRGARTILGLWRPFGFGAPGTPAFFSHQQVALVNFPPTHSPEESAPHRTPVESPAIPPRISPLLGPGAPGLDFRQSRLVGFLGKPPLIHWEISPTRPLSPIFRLDVFIRGVNGYPVMRFFLESAKNPRFGELGVFEARTTLDRPGWVPPPHFFRNSRPRRKTPPGPFPLARASKVFDPLIVLAR